MVGKNTAWLDVPYEIYWQRKGLDFLKVNQSGLLGSMQFVERIDINLILLRHNTECGEKCFSVSGAALWNSIPGNIRRSRNFGSFRVVVNNIF